MISRIGVCWMISKVNNMSLAKELLLEMRVRDTLLAMNDNEAAHYAFNRVDELMERLDLYVSQHNYKCARMGICAEDEIDQHVYITSITNR